jgi:Uma2 family endonuclease
MAVARRGLNLEQFLELPDEEPALEYVDGEVRQKVSPNTPHSALQYELAERINTFARSRQIARAFPELRTTFGGRSIVPDLAVFRWVHIPVDKSGDLLPAVRAAPDIAVEIASPGQSTNALVSRCRWYVANGVAIALLLDPIDRSVLAFHASSAIDELRGLDPIDLSPIVPGLELTVEHLFASLRGR